MMRLLITMSALLLACGATPSGGKISCKSYEDNYLTECQRYCESQLDKPGDLKGIEECSNTCIDDLKDDNTYGDQCPAELQKLSR